MIEQLVEALKNEPTKPQWVLVPSASIGWTLSERLLHEGCNWINLRFSTILELATKECAPQLLQEGWLPCPEELGPSLIPALLDTESAFLKLLDQPTLAESLWSSLQECRMSGLRADQLACLENTQKNQDFRRLFAAYEELLRKNRWIDRAGLLSSPPQFRVIGPQDRVFVYQHRTPSLLESKWLDSCPGQRLELNPRQSAEAHKRTFSHARGRFNEIESALDTIASERIPLDQVEFIVPQDDLPLFADRLAASNIQCTYEQGLPFFVSRLGQIIYALLDWLESDCNAFLLRRILRSGWLKAPPNSYRAAKLLEQAEIHWGRESYYHCFEQLAKSDPQTEGLQPLRDWLKSVFQRFPLGETHLWGRWIDGLLETVELDVFLSGQNDELDRRALRRALTELRKMTPPISDIPRFCLTIRQALRNLRTRYSRPVAGKIHVASRQTLGLSGRPHAFWLGMEEGNVLPHFTADCILSDNERALLPGLSLSQTVHDERRQRILEGLEDYPGHLRLSYSSQGEASQEGQVADWAFLSQAQKHNPQINNYDVLEQQLGPARVLALQPMAQEELEIRYPHLARGRAAQEARASDLFTTYDGYVPSAAQVWDPRISQRSVSVTRLQWLAKCPFRYFLENGLGLSSDRLEPPPSDGWLDAATRGSVLHEVYAQYHRYLRQRNWNPDQERDQPLVRKLLDQQLEMVKVRRPAPDATTEKLERSALRDDCKCFLSLEAASTNRKPIAFEVPFGMEADPDEPLSHPQPVQIKLPGCDPFLLKGRIDRIDHLPSENRHEVVDYKTGRSLQYKGKKPFDGGKLVQHALYSLVVERILELPPGSVASCYYFPHSRANSTRVQFDSPDPAVLGQILHLVLEPTTTGAFIHTEDFHQNCAYCEFRSACYQNKPENIKAKLNNPENKLLSSRQELI